MRYLAIVVLLPACAVEPSSAPPGPEQAAGAHVATVVAGVDSDARKATALHAAARFAATVDATRAPASLVSSDFSVQASLDEYVTFRDDIADHGPSARIVLTGRSVHLISAGGAYK